MIWQQISVKTRLTHQSTTRPLTSGGRDELQPNTADLRVDHQLWEDWSYKNVPVSDTKLMLVLRVGFISSHLTSNEIFPVNLRAIMGPTKIWASCNRSKARLHWLSNQGLSFLCTQMTLVGTLRPSSRDRCSSRSQAQQDCERPNVLPGQIAPHSVL